MVSHRRPAWGRGAEEPHAAIVVISTNLKCIDYHDAGTARVVDTAHLTRSSFTHERDLT
jgi:hypothetical protein